MAYGEVDKTTCTACAGTNILEFAALSRVTGNPVYEIRARRAMEAIWQARHHGHDLVGTTIDVSNGQWTRKGVYGVWGGQIGECVHVSTQTLVREGQCTVSEKERAGVNLPLPPSPLPSLLLLQTVEWVPALTHTMSIVSSPTFYWETRSTCTGSARWEREHPPHTFLLLTSTTHCVTVGSIITISCTGSLQHYAAIKKYISNGPLLVDVNMSSPNKMVRSFMDALLAFWPGLQVWQFDGTAVWK